MTSAGQKVTTDPQSKIPINEAVGTVTSDSLAGESLKSHGHFGEGNPKAGVSDQPSSSTTTNTTDTSNATKLNAAVNAEARDAQKGESTDKIINSGKGQGKEAGVGPTYAPPGGAPGGSSGGAGGASSVTGTAPVALSGTYVDPNVLKPKGNNLTEDPELHGDRKFGEIGTVNDPARVAEQKLQGVNAANAGVTPKTADMAQGGDSKFSNLGDVNA